MSKRFPLIIRKLIAERAMYRCEYSRVFENDSNYAYHIEHIISRQHGGTDDTDNLAYSCSVCNWKKGSNIATILRPEGPFVSLFNPRIDNWFEHFLPENGIIQARTNIGSATVNLLELNHPDKVIERRELSIVNRWP